MKAIFWMLPAALTAISVFAAEPALLDRMQSADANPTQKNDACFALRGDKSPEVLAVMRKSLSNQALRACAAKNLRAAAALEQFRDALKDEMPDVRAVALIELADFGKIEDLPAIAAAASDPNLLVSENAVYALASYADPRAVPYLAGIATKGGMPGMQALGRLSQRREPQAIAIARRMIQHREPTEKLAAIKVIGEMGDKSDLPSLKEVQAKETGELSSAGRGFGLMPAISLSRAAKTAIDLIEHRGS